jgi:hypothetical protein
MPIPMFLSFNKWVIWDAQIQLFLENDGFGEFGRQGLSLKFTNILFKPARSKNSNDYKNRLSPMSF